MALVDDLIAEALDDARPIAALLRKCLVLSYLLENSTLRDWVTGELNGYADNAELPSYRICQAPAVGHFAGGWGSSISNKSLPSYTLKEEHRHFAETYELRQPIASYDLGEKKDSTDVKMIVEWPADLIALYQESFYKGYALMAAHQVIPNSVVKGLVDVVRTKTLQFALELKEKISNVGEIKEVNPKIIESMIVNHIYGGTTIIASEAKDFSIVSQVNVGKGDANALEAALLDKLGLHPADVEKLGKALADDKAAQPETPLGKKTLEWVAGIGKTIGKEGLKVTGEVAKAAALAWIKQHTGT